MSQNNNVIRGTAIDNKHQIAAHQLVFFSSDNDGHYMDYILAASHVHALSQNVIPDSFAAKVQDYQNDPENKSFQKSAFKSYKQILEHTVDKPFFQPLGYIKGSALSYRFAYDPESRILEEKPVSIILTQAKVAEQVSYAKAQKITADTKAHPYNDIHPSSLSARLTMLYDLAANYKQKHNGVSYQESFMPFNFQEVIRQMHFLVQRASSQYACENMIHCVHRQYHDNSLMDTASIQKHALQTSNNVGVPITTTAKPVPAVNNGLVGYFLLNGDNLVSQETAAALAYVAQPYEAANEPHERAKRSKQKSPRVR